MQKIYVGKTFSFKDIEKSYFLIFFFLRHDIKKQNIMLTQILFRFKLSDKNMHEYQKGYVQSISNRINSNSNRMVQIQTEIFC